jgi:hypothetical protein
VYTKCVWTTCWQSTSEVVLESPISIATTNFSKQWTHFRPGIAHFRPGKNRQLNELRISARHVPRAERNNHVIQECVRAAYHRFPCTHLPRTLVKFLVMESTKKLNFFPNKYGVSKVFSPHMIMHQENLDFEYCAVCAQVDVLIRDANSTCRVN